MRRVTVYALLGAAISSGVALLGQDLAWKEPPVSNFPLAGGSWSNQRYSTLDGINTTNIGRLGATWMIHVDDGRPGNIQATPVVVNGVMYVSTGTQNVLAVDAKTGFTRWRYTPDARGLGGSNRGVVVAEGKAFFAQRDNTLVALDQQTGSVAWTTKLTDQARAYTSAATTYYDGLVYIGIAGGEVGVRGKFGAYDAKTGKEVWSFWTIPGPGERGSDTWQGDSYKHGGGPIWNHPAIDPDLHMIYVPVGNAGPDNDGSDRAGDNLFTASIVALDAKTGAYKWHFQEVHHDLWDYDAGAPPMLADVRFRGAMRKILMHAGKTGYLYILDRETGKPLVGIEEKPVPQEPRIKTARTQPFPIGDSFVPTCPEPDSVLPGYEKGCIFSSYWDKAIVLAPGTQGGVAWAPTTFSPKTGLAYITAAIINSAHDLRRQVWDEQSQRFVSPGPTGQGYNRPGGEPRAGTLTAMDPTTNKIVWQKRLKFPGGAGSGLLSTAGGLLFRGESDGNLVAYDIRNGDVLWKFQTGAGADAPVATYQVNGEQYVAVMAGGNTFQLSRRDDLLWAFKLGGTIPQAPAPPEPSVTQPPGPGAPQ